MDDGQPGALDGTRDDVVEGIRAAGHKRPCPTGVNQHHGIGNHGGANDASSSRQRRSPHQPLSLLAGCALLGQGSDNSQESSGDQNGQVRSTSNSYNRGATIHTHPDGLSAHNNNNALRDQSLWRNDTPAESPPQNTMPSQGGSHPRNVNQGMMGIQPNVMLGLGRSQPSSMLDQHHFAATQPHSAVSNGGAFLRPFGMSPQELLNYAVLVNILHKGIAQGNAAISSLAFNRQQSILDGHNSIQGGGGNNPNCGAASALDPQQRSHESVLIAALNKFQGGGGIGGTPSPTAGTYPSQPQGCNGFLHLDGINQSAVNPLNNRDMNNPIPANGAQVLVNNNNSAAASSHSPSKDNDSALTLPSHVFHARQEAPSRRRVQLWTTDDEKRLSIQQCWLRKQIETFPASARDIRTRGRNRLLDIGQVGIQCIHCKSLPQEGRGKGSSYFPASIKSIYQSAQNMMTFHFKEDTCPLIPRRLLQQMKDAGETSAINPRMAPKAGKSRAGGGKAYWEASAASVTGLIDTTVGIRYSDDQNCQPSETSALAAESRLDHNNDQVEESVFTRLDDKGKVTDFCFLLMSQFGPYCSQVPNDIIDGEDWGSDNENEVPLPSIGIVCQFCRGGSDDGKQPKGVFLSSKADTMSRNKNLARMYNHLLVCAPEDLKSKLVQAKNIHLPQSDRLKKGWKKQFFETVCERLHASLEEGQTSDATSLGQTSDDGDNGLSTELLKLPD